MGFREVALGSIGYVLEFKRPLAKALLAPFSFYTLLDAARLLEPSRLIVITWLLLTLVAHTLFAVTTHRIILLGPKSIPEWGLLRWSLRETLFAVHVVGFGAILGVIAVLLSSVVIMLTGLPDSIGKLLVIGVAGWAAGRMSLVFPAIAIGHGVSFKLSWNLTKDRQTLLFLVIVLFPLILVTPAKLLSLLPSTFLLTSFLQTLATVFTVAALSVAYKVICREVYGT